MWRDRASRIDPDCRMKGSKRERKEENVGRKQIQRKNKRKMNRNKLKDEKVSS
jgi:hypothetical protein